MTGTHVVRMLAGGGREHVGVGGSGCAIVEGLHRLARRHGHAVSP